MSTVPGPAREYANLLLRLHALDPHGEKDGPELVTISDAMDAPWQRMDGFYRELMGGLSIDLYALAAGSAASAHATRPEPQMPMQLSSPCPQRT